MRLSNKFYKLASGENNCFYANSANEVEMYVFNDTISKNLITFDENNIARCTSTNQKFSYNKFIKLSDSHSAVCLGKNISVINS